MNFQRKKTKQTYVILHNIRSVHNVGSIFRTADAAGIAKIFLIGITPAPVDRFGRTRKDFLKVSLGAERSVLWELAPTITPVLKTLKKEGVTVVAVEQSKDSVDYRKLKPSPATAFIFGNEVEGLPASVLKASDMICEIPMRGEIVRQAHHPRQTGVGKESLNVGVAAGIVLFNRISR